MTAGVWRRGLCLLLAMLVAASALPQLQDDDAFLSALLDQTDPAPSPATGGADTSCCDPADDTCFLLALSGGCDNVTAVQQPATRCERGQFTCTPYYRCDEQHIVADQLDEFDIRIGKPQFEDEFEFITHSECPRFGDVCCTDPKPDSRNNGNNQQHVPQCGKRNEFGIGARIIGFNESESQFGEFPWMAAVLRVDEVGGEERNFFVCGGSLIHPQVVMTAAHCVHEFDADVRLRVRLGEWDTQAESELFLHQDVDVQRVITHEDFTPRRLNDDVALLILQQPARLADHVDTLCLPDPNVDYTGAECIATGWGQDAFEKGQFQTVLKQIDLPLVNHAPCQAALRKTRLRKYFRLDSSFTCAGGVDGQDTCTGDGGSPLACRLPGQPGANYVQLGVVSWGIGCGLPGVPGVYADVKQQVSWIQRHLAQLDTANVF